MTHKKERTKGKNQENTQLQNDPKKSMSENKERIMNVTDHSREQICGAA